MSEIKNIHEHASWFASYEDSDQAKALILCQKAFLYTSRLMESVRAPMQKEIDYLKKCCHDNANESTEWFKRCIELQNVLANLIPVLEDKSNELYLNANDWDIIQRAKAMIRP